MNKYHIDWPMAAVSIAAIAGAIVALIYGNQEITGTLLAFVIGQNALKPVLVRKVEKTDGDA